MNDKDKKHEDERDTIFGDLIHSYSRAQAIEDGVLIGIAPEVASKAGFRIPIALTYEAWASCIPVPDCLKDDPEQSEGGRLHDLLRVLRFNICHCTEKDQTRLNFWLALQIPGTEDHEKLELTAVCGPGDNCEPVLTVMLPDQD